MSKTDLFWLNSFNTNRKEEIQASFYLLLYSLIKRMPAYDWSLGLPDVRKISTRCFLNYKLAFFIYFDNKLALKKIAVYHSTFQKLQIYNTGNIM